ncbi:hypothetical protein AC579_5377 [Pseudocercospora musae]|uniref:Uncharacterized protein n=1 Tax=Pseudocercospora musae TaxID=113226 RepID=A0A139H3T6_9PEZI|nr:hypothetical protein AC579_5377 [Pseudocercospora musae]
MLWIGAGLKPTGIWIWELGQWPWRPYQKYLHPTARSVIALGVVWRSRRLVIVVLNRRTRKD